MAVLWTDDDPEFIVTDDGDSDALTKLEPMEEAQ